MKIDLATCLTAALALGASPAGAAEYYVAPSGSDGAAGTQSAPFATVQKGLEVAQPGDNVLLANGSYAEAPQTVRDGTANNPIAVRAQNTGQAVITASGNVFTIRHAYHLLEGVVIDGQLGAGRALRLRNASDHIVLRQIEVRNSGNNCVDIAQSDDVLIEHSTIHHCLLWNGGPQDAHGVTGDAPTNLTIRQSEIYLVSGDAIQLSPSRQFWDNLLVEHCRLWTGPLPEAAGSFPQGEMVGENAFDSKTPSTGPRPRAVFHDVEVYGFRGFITNQGAFNVKENVDFTLDGATVYDSELAFRLRGPAQAVLRNAVTYGNDAAVRYEDAIENLTLQNVTLADPLMDGGGGAPVGMVFDNALFVAGSVPAEAAGGQANLAADDSFFVDAAGGDYHLLQTAPAVDAGVTLAEVTGDRDGVGRPVGAAYDVGAYEWTDQPPGTGGSGTGGGVSSSSSGSSSSGSGGGAASGSGASEEDSGCGCRLLPAGGAAGGWLVALLLAAGAMARRRHRDSSAVLDPDRTMAAFGNSLAQARHAATLPPAADRGAVVRAPRAGGRSAARGLPPLDRQRSAAADALRAR